MKIGGFGRFVFIAQWVMIVLLPALLIVPPLLLGVNLGMGFLVLMAWAPLLAGFLLIPPILTLFDRAVRKARASRLWFGVASCVLWAVGVFIAIVILRPMELSARGSSTGDGTALDVMSQVAEVVLAIVYAVTVLLAIVGIVFSMRRRHVTAGA